MAWCMMAPSHYLKQCWLTVLRSSPFIWVQCHKRYIHVPWPSITKISLEIYNIKFLSNHPEANELIYCPPTERLVFHRGDILRALRFKSSCIFLKWSPKICVHALDWRQNQHRLPIPTCKCKPEACTRKTLDKRSTLNKPNDLKGFNFHNR